MRHYVLTRSAYGPEWTAEANYRRLGITRAVTARLMAAQTCRDWTWVVLVDPRDPLLAQRLAVFEGAGVPVVPIYWQPAVVAQAPWDRSASTTTVQRVAATGYTAPWRSVMPDDDTVLMTRIDDDDGFAVDALERYQAAAARNPAGRRVVLVLPEGFRVYDGRYTRVYQANNAMHTLVTPPGDTLSVYDYGHMQLALGGHVDLAHGQRAPHRGRHPKAPAPVQFVDTWPAWLWVRHQDTISGHQRATRPISGGLRRLFPIDWAAL